MMGEGRRAEGTVEAESNCSHIPPDALVQPSGTWACWGCVASQIGFHIIESCQVHPDQSLRYRLQRMDTAGVRGSPPDRGKREGASSVEGWFRMSDAGQNEGWWDTLVVRPLLYMYSRMKSWAGRRDELLCKGITKFHLPRP